MSAFKCIKTLMKHKDVLVAALEQVKPAWKGKIVVGENLPCYGFHGDDRTKLDPTSENWAPKCEVVIPGSNSKHGSNLVGGASNDLGVARDKDGNLMFVVSEYDSSRYGGSWQESVQKVYNSMVAEKEAPKVVADFVAGAQKAGHKVEVAPGGMIKIDQTAKAGNNITASQITVGVKKKMTMKEFLALKSSGHNIHLAVKTK